MKVARPARWGIGLLCWLIVSAALALVLFVSDERETTVAGHEAVLSPDLSGRVSVATGPVLLPDLRMEIPGRVGVEVVLGKTQASSLEELVARYGVLASNPEGQEVKIRKTVVSMAWSAVLRGAVLGGLIVGGGVVLWLLVGRERREELGRRLRRGVRTRRAAWVGPVAVVTAAGVAVALLVPWAGEDRPVPNGRWVSLQAFVGSGVPVPADLQDVEVRGDVTTRQTRRLVESAIGTFTDSHAFYDDAVTAAETRTWEPPAAGETRVVFVSDRHDNIGMDRVVKAVAEQSGATAVFDAGDDTSTGSTWEDFSLDSLDSATADLDDRWAVAGNHDHGEFTSSYLAERGWTMLEGEVVDGPGGSTLLGIPDPRSSGLGAWRDAGGTSFGDAEDTVAETACEADANGDRVTTILVHDANLGRSALRRGCADLVLGGHVHVESGPTRVTGENGEVGYSYTLGTTGGAAYAIALGKPRRTAQVGIVSYVDGVPAGIQTVSLESNGKLHVSEEKPLTYPEESSAGRSSSDPSSGASGR